MFEAYKIAVKISLVNHVSAGLLSMSKQMIGLQGNAKALKKELDGIKMIALVGGAAAGTGFMGLGIMAKMLKPAQEYAHQLNIINMAGWTQRDIANAVGDAWKNTGNVITTTATENLRTLLDLKNVLGDFGEARMALPIVSRIQSVLAASSEEKISGNSKDLAYSMAKALDIIGAAQNKESFESQAEQMAKVIIATQGRVTPEAFKSTFQYARQAKYGLSDVFKYQILPSLIQENAAGGGGGGGSRGVGPMLAAFYRTTNQGYINKKSLPILESLGLVGASSALKTTTSGTTVGHFKGWELAGSNPFEWVQTVLMPAIYKQFGKDVSKQKIQDIINQAFRGNQLGASLALEFALKPVNFLRDQQNIIKTMSTADAYKAALSNDPNTAFDALSAQWANFKTSFMMGVVPVLIPALIKLTNMFNDLARWGRENPLLMKSIAIGLASVFGAMAFGGTVTLLAAAFKGLSLAIGFGAVGGVAGITGIAAALGPVGAALLALAAAAGVVYLAYKFLHSASKPPSPGTPMSHPDGIPNPLSNPRFKNVNHPGVLTPYINSFVDWATTPLIPPAPAKSQNGKSGDVYLDGKKVGVVVAPHVTNSQAKSAMRPQAGTTRHDGNMSLTPVGAH